MCDTLKSYVQFRCLIFSAGCKVTPLILIPRTYALQNPCFRLNYGSPRSWAGPESSSVIKYFSQTSHCLSTVSVWPIPSVENHLHLRFCQSLTSYTYGGATLAGSDGQLAGHQQDRKGPRCLSLLFSQGMASLLEQLEAGDAADDDEERAADARFARMLQRMKEGGDGAEREASLQSEIDALSEAEASMEATKIRLRRFCSTALGTSVFADPEELVSRAVTDVAHLHGACVAEKGQYELAEARARLSESTERNRELEERLAAAEAALRREEQAHRKDRLEARRMARELRAAAAAAAAAVTAGRNGATATGSSGAEEKAGGPGRRPGDLGDSATSSAGGGGSLSTPSPPAVDARTLVDRIRRERIQGAEVRVNRGRRRARQACGYRCVGVSNDPSALSPRSLDVSVSSGSLSLCLTVSLSLSLSLCISLSHLTLSLISSAP